MRVGVFTGSADGTPAHRAAAQALARDLAQASVGIVYGGGRVGLMGVLADTALAAGGEVVGVMPQHLVDGEIAHPGLTRLDVVAGMHERKARMAELADAFVALPGGAGTLEELFEVWTWGQLGLHTKPTALLDPDDFYAPLLSQLDAMTGVGYLTPAYRAALGVVSDAAGLLALVEGYRHPASKWRQLDPEPEPAQLTSVGWLHLDQDGRLLAVRTHGRDRLHLPGGKPNPGESLEQALRREVEEELTVQLHDLQPAFTVTAPAHGLPGGTVLTMHCFHARPEGDLRPSREIEGTAWLDGPGDPRAAPALQDALKRLAATRSR